MTLSQPSPDIALEVRDLEVAYGDFQVLWGVSLAIKTGRISAILGPNGSGKSTLLNTVVGMSKPLRGSVWLSRRRVDGLATHQLVEQGLVLVPERRRLFPDLKVWENLWLGGWTPNARAYRKESLTEVLELFPDLAAKREQRAGELSGGQQQMVAIGRGLMSRPSLLVLDEPFLGISEPMIDVISAALLRISSRGVTVLLIDQDVPRALALAHDAFVLDAGLLVLEGSSEELLAGTAIQDVYLGA